MDTAKEEYNISFISILVICSYIACQMISNIASVKIANVLTLAVDGGTFYILWLLQLEIWLIKL